MLLVPIAVWVYWSVNERRTLRTIKIVLRFQTNGTFEKVFVLNNTLLSI